MIVIYHNNECVTQIISNEVDATSFNKQQSIAAVLMNTAIQFPNRRIFWCHEQFKDNLNLSDFEQYFHHNKMMLSFNPSHSNYLSDSIGYVEQSPFIKVNKKVRYPTWQMSSAVGVIHASVLLTLNKVIKRTIDFNYFLNSLAKLAMPKGLFCYSEPKLFIGGYEKQVTGISRINLYKFVKQHYKKRWLFLLFLNELIYENKIPLVPFVNALFYISKRIIVFDLNRIAVNSTLKIKGNSTIDVIIPTIGRKKYLYDVLCDLKSQTHLPENVIIVEQNPTENSTSELDYITNEDWPFTIKHTFTHRTGVCNARNIALSKVKSDWVFLNDDDNRFDEHLLQNTLQCIYKYGVHALITSYLKKIEKLHYKISHQTGIFGSGNSFVKTSCLKDIAFDMAFEFGYGEDSDFGMQLRHKGVDIMYFSNLKILHLFAPMGGFRIKPKLAWDNEVIQPKPSPTIMLLKLKYDSKEQLRGYKTILFLKLYFKGVFKNPISFYKSFQEKWNTSQVWAEKINEYEK